MSRKTETHSTDVYVPELDADRDIAIISQLRSLEESEEAFDADASSASGWSAVPQNTAPQSDTAEYVREPDEDEAHQVMLRLKALKEDE